MCRADASSGEETGGVGWFGVGASVGGSFGVGNSGRVGGFGVDSSSTASITAAPESGGSAAGAAAGGNAVGANETGGASAWDAEFNGEGWIDDMKQLKGVRPRIVGQNAGKTRGVHHGDRA